MNSPADKSHLLDWRSMQQHRLGGGIFRIHEMAVQHALQIDRGKQADCYPNPSLMMAIPFSLKPESAERLGLNLFDRTYRVDRLKLRSR